MDDDTDNQNVIDALKQPAQFSSKQFFPQRPEGAISDWITSQGEKIKSSLGDILAHPENIPGTDGLGAGKLGTFIGQGAKYWSMPKQFMASELEMKGHTPEQIFDATGLFQGHGGEGGEWKKEISDQGMKALPLGKVRANTIEGGAQHFIEHPELFNNYPETADMTVRVDPGWNKEGYAKFNPVSSLITLGGPIREKGLSPTQQMKLLHELGGHTVQTIEGWPHGGTAEVIGAHLEDRLIDAYQRTNNPIYKKQLTDYGKDKKYIADEAYRRLPGETDARNIENRYRLGKAGVPAYFPHTEDPEMVRQLLMQRGWHSGVHTVESMPQDLRMLYDRTPLTYSKESKRPVLMQGDPTYPWKTEDRPRWLQFDYSK